MTKLTSIALSIFLLASSASVGWIAHRVSVITRKGEELTRTTQQTMTRGYEYVDWQLTDFQSSAYQKRLQATVATGAYIGSMAKSFNVRVIPEIISILRDAREKNLSSLNALTLSFNDFIQHTDKSVNIDILPAVARSFEKLNVSIEDLDGAIKLGIEKGVLTLDAVNKTLTDPHVASILAHLDETSANVASGTKHLDSTVASVDEGFKRFPTLMALWEKYSKTASRYQRFVYLAQILNLLGGIPRP